MRKIYSYILIFSIIQITSCKKFVEIDPPKTDITTEVVFADDVTATSAMDGLYSEIINGSGFVNHAGIAVLAGLYADEFINYDNSKLPFYNNSLSPTTAQIKELWDRMYKIIYYSNVISENLQISGLISMPVKTQLAGEARFIRAFCHFYLSNIFGNIPIVTTSDYRVNASAKQANADSVRKFVISELETAQSELSQNYDFVLGERVRPNKYAALALLSRVYLYDRNWVMAELMSNKVIENESLFQLVPLDDVFVKNSGEAIWQLAQRPNRNTYEGSIFIPSTTPLFVSLRSDFYDSFELNDNRKSKWIGESISQSVTYYYPFKYKFTGSDDVSDVSEYSMVLRLAEQYLIRAEAQIQQDNIVDGVLDLNELRSRAEGNGVLTRIPDDISKEEALLFVERERFLELFSEWGHRWFDLKRTGRVENILLPLKGSSWNTNTDIVFPIPQSEIDNNINLLQNEGYF